MQLTIKELTSGFTINGIPCTITEANLLFKFFRASGDVKLAGIERKDKSKGRPSMVWDVPNNLTFRIKKTGLTRKKRVG